MAGRGGSKGRSAGRYFREALGGGMRTPEAGVNSCRRKLTRPLTAWMLYKRLTALHSLTSKMVCRLIQKRMAHVCVWWETHMGSYMTCFACESSSWDTPETHQYAHACCHLLRPA